MNDLSIPKFHGGDIRGQTAAGQGIAVGRFARMFDDPGIDRPDFATHAADRAMLWALAEIMTGVKPAGDDRGKPIRKMAADPHDDSLPSEPTDAADENPLIPAGYTYFGQFVDHDISFDPTPLNARRIDLAAIDDFRTPALDLDSVYGGGPDVQPYLYDQTSRHVILLRTGDAVGKPATPSTRTTRDHLRLGADADGKRIAVIGDKRNDENKIVAQVHTTLIALHNKVSTDDALLAKMGFHHLATANDRFNAALTTVRWHYQWVVLYDFVNRLCAPDTVDNVLNAGGTPRIGKYLSSNPRYAYLPFEFSVAAYRLGHSMVRPSYALNSAIGTQGDFARLRIPIFKPGATATAALNGFGDALPEGYGIDWSFFLDGLAKDAAATEEPPMAIPQLSYRIDANLVMPLQSLPEFDPDGSRTTQFRPANLAYRNLLRGSLDNLPSGEAVADALGIARIGFDKLWRAGAKDTLDDSGLRQVDEARAAFGHDHRHRIERRTPLWYYILREAEIEGISGPGGADDEFGGRHLGAVGSAIVAQTFVGLLWRDKTSFLHGATRFHPVIAHGDRFELADLFRYALG